MTAKTPTDAEIGAAVRVLAAVLFGGVATVSPPATGKTRETQPTTAGSDATGSTPEGQKADGPPAGNSQNLSTEAFTKVGLDFAKSKADNGASLKAIMAEFGVERLGAVPVEKYDEFLAKIEEGKLA